MKQKLLNLLAIFVAFLSAIPIANAAEITFSVNTTPLWGKLGHYEAAKTIAVSNNMLYVLADPTKQTTIAYVGQNTNWTTFESGYGTWAHGFAFDNDDAGNIVMQGNGTGSATTKLIVYPAGATSNASKKEITITSPGGRTDFIRIQGNILSGTAYVWFVPANTQKIIRVKIVNGKEDSRTEWTHTLGNASSTEIAYMLDDGRIYLHHRKGSPNYAYILTVPANGGAVTSSEEVLSGSSASNLTSDIFNIQGTYFHVYNAGNEGQDIRFNVKNLSTGAILASNITPFNGEKWDKSGTSNLSNFNSIGTIIRPIKVNVNTVDLYCFTPEHGASVYRVTATIKAEGINSPKATISNETNVVVSWSKPTTDVPTNYSVSYSSDGTNWSTPVVTSNLSHTFNNLSPGSYTFKIVPYYEQYLTYGAEAKTSNIEIVIVKGAPITNLTYEYIKNDGANAGRQDITLKWSAPTGMTGTSVTGYKVYHEGNLLASLNADELTYTHQGVTENATYKVVPLFDGIAENASYGAEITTTEVTAPAPTGYKFIVTKKWEAEGTLTEASDNPKSAGKSIAVSNGVLYVSAMNQYSTISYVNKDQYPSWPNFPSGYNKGAFGYGMDNDDAGNIIVAANSVGSGNPTKFAVYPAGATSNANKKEITLSGEYLPGARADYIGTQGNIYNGTGYLWLAQNATNTIKRIKLENKSGVPTPTAITTWSHNFTNNSSEVIIRPLEDGRIYYHNHQNACKIITLPENGGEIPAANVETISLSQTQTDNFSSDAIILKGNVLNIRNAGIDAQDISFEIYNITAKGFVTYNDQQVITPFEGVRTDDTTNPLSGISKIGSIVRAVKVDDETVDVYVYSPFHGASCYRISAETFVAETAPVENLKGEFKFNDVGEIWGRQDVILTWDEPIGYSGATITGYNIYRDNKLQKTVDASTHSFTDINIVASPTYIVAPLYNGVEMHPKSVTVDYTFIPIPPVDFKARTYNGYGSVQLFWKRVIDVGIKPSYFNIYRDDMLVGTSQSFNFYEDKLSAGSHKYVVEAVYNEMAEEYIGAEGRTAKSDPVTIIVEPRDTEKTTYTLEEIYNYTIEEINNQPANFENRNYYRQGAYYNGKWYIAQRSDHLTKDDNPETDEKSDWESGVAEARGGVVIFSAIDPRTGIESKPITLPEGSNVGIATDSKGNIFVRQNNFSRLSATAPTGAPEVPTWVKDYFSRRLTSGYIYLASQGYSEATRVDVDLSSLYNNRNLQNILPDWSIVPDAYVDNAYKTQRGRSDYYSLEGDVTSDEGGYLYFVPSKSAYVVKVNIKVPAGSTTATIDAANAQIYNLKGEYTTVDNTIVEVKHGIENYAFPVDGRDAFIGQIRSNGYFGIHGEGEYHPIFTTESRINNSGGTTIEFNNDLFIISPQTMYSASSGDFMISKGIKTDVTNVATADLSNPLPVATWRQTDQASSANTNASGNWLFAELGTFAISQNNTVKCVYIYQYVPGERIAKYVLFPNNVFPAPPVAINLDPTYKSSKGEVVVDQNSSTGANKDAVDLLSFDGYAYWSKPDYDNDKADKYRYNSYTVRLYQEGDLNPTTTVYKLGSDELNALGSETTPDTIKIGNKEFEYNYRIPINNADNKRIWRIEVNTTYVNIEEGKENDIHESEVSFDHTYDLYNGIPAEGKVKVYTNPAFPVWYDENWNLVYKYMHRVDIDFNKPVFDEQRVEPVTHYEIWVDKAKDGVYEEQLKEFNLMTGLYNPSTRADVGTVASQIKITDGKIVSETYNPNTSKGYALGEEELAANRTEDYQCVLTFYQLGSINDNAGGAMGDGDKTELNPANWNYQLRSVYAAGNARISTTEIYNMEAGQTPIYTGAEGVKDNASTLKLYPVPTDFMLNIECDEAIYLVEVYNEAGQLMMNIPGSYLPTMQIDMSNLDNGYYFVRVNNNAPVKILKK